MRTEPSWPPNLSVARANLDWLRPLNGFEPGISIRSFDLREPFSLRRIHHPCAFSFHICKIHKGSSQKRSIGYNKYKPIRSTEASMNKKFFQLPEEKQQRIINAGFYVFSQNSYKKSPVSEIAGAAGISKSLLFHYFHNKKEFYLFLWDTAAQITLEYLNAFRCYEPTDLFDMMERGMKAKFMIMEQHPHMAAFSIKAFYEKDPEISGEIQSSYHNYFDRKAADALAALNPDDFVPGLDLQMMHREMYWASEGYLWEMLQRGKLDAAQMGQDFEQLLQFWKSIYKNREKSQ